MKGQLMCVQGFGKNYIQHNLVRFKDIWKK